MPEFKLLRGGIQDRYLASRAKIQIFGGGYGNGKTGVGCVRAIQLSDVYPGSNMLLARSTYPKLNDTLRKEFLKWCPKNLIKSFPMSVNANNTCTLQNGTTINFRYIAQQGKSEESTTSNLLSATYDFILVDQMEDPEITHKDFLDLVGRLRGSTPYRGNDPTMPRTGPRWMGITVNPTRNWVYHKLVKPIHDYEQRGIIGPDLLCLRDPQTQEPILIDGKAQLLVELFEGSSYENAHNLPEDFLQGMESLYTGQMKDRFLMGKWAAYEGLVYPQFDETLHMIDPRYMRKYLDKLVEEDYDIEWIEGYDYGIASPSCYLLSFVDPVGMVHTVDGFYKREFKLDEQYQAIKDIRRKWGVDEQNIIDADPDIFRRKAGRDTGTTVSDLFWTDGNLLVRRASNDIIHGITKVSGYLNVRTGFENPYTLETVSPSFFCSLDLDFFATEIAGYFWKKNSVTGERVDEPQDANDHALDTLKYLFTTRPDASKLRPVRKKAVPAYMHWNEQDQEDMNRSRRHG